MGDSEIDQMKRLALGEPGDYASDSDTGLAPRDGGYLPPGVSNAQAQEALAKLQNGSPQADVGAALTSPPPVAQRGVFATPTTPPQQPDTVTSPGGAFRRGPAPPTPPPAGGGGGVDWYKQARRAAGLEGLDPQLQENATRTAERAQNDMLKAGVDEANGMDEQAKLAREHADKLAAQAAGEAQFQQDHVKALDAQMAKVRESVDAYNAKGIDVDAARGGVVGRIGGAIAMALGAFGTGLVGGENDAMKIVQKNIDDRIHAQQREIEKAKGNIDAQQGLYSMLRQQGLDHQAAAAGERINTIDQYKAKLSAMAMSTGAEDVRNRAQIAIEAADAERAKASKDFEQGLRANAYQMQQRAAAAAAAQAAAERKHAEERADKDREYGLKVAELQDKEDERAAARDEKVNAESEKYGERLGAAKIPEAQAQADRTRKGITGDTPSGFSFPVRVIEKLGGEKAAQWLASDEGAQTRRNVNQMVINLAHAQGRVSESEIKEVRKAFLGDESPEAIKGFLSSYDQLLKSAQGNIDASTSPQARALYKLRQIQGQPQRPPGFQETKP